MKTSLEQEEMTWKSALPVDFHVRIVEIVAKWRVIIFIVVIIIVARNGGLGRILGIALVRVRAVVAHSWVSHVSTRGLLLLGRVFNILRVMEG